MTTAAPPAPKVFISYRRQETAGHAGRLYDAMAARFGEQHVFVDVDLDPGVDFVERITEAVGSCHVLLVVMGPQWAVLRGDHQRPRIAEPDDYVRLEVETALRRADVTVIPVLVAGAQMPDPDDLPEALRPLARRNALELSDVRWRYDVGRLNAVLDERLADTAVLQTVPKSPTTSHHAARIPSTARLFIDGMLVAGLAALVGRWIADPIDPSEATGEGGQMTLAILRRTVTWALLGVALAIWLGFVRGEGRRIAGRALLGLELGALAGALGGVIQFAPQYLGDLDLERETIETISIGAFAVSGALIGALLGALWTPRNLLAGLVGGLAAGAAVRLLWNAVDWSGDTAFEDALGIGIQCLLIVGLVLAVLQTLSAQPSAAVERGGVDRRGSAPA